MYAETADDLHRKFSETYALFNEKLVYFSSFISKDDKIEAALTDTDQEQQIVNLTSEEIGELTFDSMYVNNTELDVKDKRGHYQIAATLFKRKPERQWRRGLGSENTSITCPIAGLYQRFGKSLTHWDRQLSFNLVERLQSPTYPTYNEAIKLCDVHQAVAFSPMFAICLSNISNEKFLIASKHGFIGEGIKDHMWIYHVPSQQEITDFIVRSKQNISMEVAPCPQAKVE